MHSQAQHKTVNFQAGVRYTHKSALKTAIHGATLQSSVCVKCCTSGYKHIILYSRKFCEHGGSQTGTAEGSHL